MADLHVLKPETPLEKGLFDLVPCGLVICDAEGLVLRANAFFRDLSGLAETEAGEKRPFHQYMTRPSRFIFNAQVMPQLKHLGTARELALDILGPDGTGVAVLVNANRDADSGRYHFSVFPARDRREHERQLLKAQKELTRHRDYLDLAEKLAHVGHWRVDLGTSECEWSPQIFAITGLDPKAYVPRVGDGVVKFCEDGQESADAILARAIKTGEPFTYCKRLIRHGSGDVRNVEASGICERDVRGVVTGLFGIFRDVTDRVAGQAALTASEARYRLLADESNDIITTFDLAGNFEYLSPAVEKVLGYRPEDLIGSNVRDIIHPDNYEATVAAYRTYVTSNNWDNAPRVQYRARHKDGHVIWAEAHPAAILDPTGTRIIAFQDVVRDISRQKATEEALARASIEANAAAEAKANFLATMSHELRTPLTSIIGFSGLLRDLLTDSEDLRKYSTRIHSAGQGLLGLINDILDHSKLEAGQLELDLAPASVAEIAVEVAEMLAFQASAKGLTITLEGADTLPPLVLVDDARLRQVLLNLVGNAVKFTEHGGVSVTLSQSQREDANYLQVSVQDTGPGISEAGQQRLFQRFSQVDRSAHDMPGGTGLGLSICKQLTELMSGTIGVRSEPGHGAEFWFEIPLPEMDSADEQGVFLDGPIRAGRILVVDDQEAVAELLVNLLTSYGHTVDIAGNGYDAVEACRRAPYDLILMDINMPVMDGFAATRAIREGCPFNDESPILALTAAGGEPRTRACLAAGMNAMLTKPIVPSTLMNAVALWLSAPPSERMTTASALRVTTETNEKIG